MGVKKANRAILVDRELVAFVDEQSRGRELRTDTLRRLLGLPPRQRPRQGRPPKKRVE